jgi:hypothetical protein
MDMGDANTRWPVVARAAVNEAKDTSLPQASSAQRRRAQIKGDNQEEACGSFLGIQVIINAVG